MAGWGPALPGEGRRKGVGQQRQRDKDRRDKIQVGWQRRGCGGNEGPRLSEFVAQAAVTLVGRIGLLGGGRKIADRCDRAGRGERLVKMALKRQALNEESQEREQRDETPRRGLFQVKTGGDGTGHGLFT